MAAIADAHASLEDVQQRLRAVWQPIIHALVDADPVNNGEGANPNYVGFTLDTQRPVFLARETSHSGVVYRKFVIRRG